MRDVFIDDDGVVQQFREAPPICPECGEKFETHKLFMVHVKRTGHTMLN